MSVLQGKISFEVYDDHIESHGEGVSRLQSCYVLGSILKNCLDEDKESTNFIKRNRAYECVRVFSETLDVSPLQVEWKNPLEESPEPDNGYLISLKKDKGRYPNNIKIASFTEEGYFKVGNSTYSVEDVACWMLMPYPESFEE